MSSNKQIANFKVLKSILPEDMRHIIQGCLGSGSAQADYKKIISVYELFVLENKPVAEIAKLFMVTKGTIEHKINRLVALVERELIIIEKLAPDTDLLPLPINRLIMSDRTLHALARAGVLTIGDLLRRGENDLSKTYNFGRKTLNETKTVLKSLRAYLRSGSGQANAIEKLKARSEERANARGKWSRRDHEQLVRVLTDFEGRLTEAGNFIELILESSPKAHRHVQQGFVLPYHIWKRLWSWRESQDIKDAEVASGA